jgi:hypothetical protein
LLNPDVVHFDFGRQRIGSYEIGKPAVTQDQGFGLGDGADEIKR